MKKLFKVSALVLGLGLGFSQGASASGTIYGLDSSGVLSGDGVVISDSISSGQSFSDVYNFSLGAGSAWDLGAIVTATYSSSAVNFSSFNAGLYDVSNGGNQLVANLAPTDNGSSVWNGSTNVFSLDSTKQYAFEVSGKALTSTNSDDFSQYTGSLSVSPVPEPEEWAMMMLGLPLMGLVARRKNKPVMVISA